MWLMIISYRTVQNLVVIEITNCEPQWSVRMLSRVTLVCNNCLNNLSNPASIASALESRFRRLVFNICTSTTFDDWSIFSARSTHPTSLITPQSLSDFVTIIFEIRFHPPILAVGEDKKIKTLLKMARVRSLSVIRFDDPFLFSMFLIAFMLLAMHLFIFFLREKYDDTSSLIAGSTPLRRRPDWRAWTFSLSIWTSSLMAVQESRSSIELSSDSSMDFPSWLCCVCSWMEL